MFLVSVGSGLRDMTISWRDLECKVRCDSLFSLIKIVNYLYCCGFKLLSSWVVGRVNLIGVLEIVLTLTTGCFCVITSISLITKRVLEIGIQVSHVF